MSKINRDASAVDPNTETVKKDWRRDKLATRIDLRMPNEIYDRVLEIAISSGEKINPKTNQVRVTATLNKLIELGIQHYPEANPIKTDPTAQPADATDLERGYRELSDKYQKLEQKLSYISLILGTSQGLTLERVEAIVVSHLEAALEPIAAEQRANRAQAHRIDAIEAHLAKLTKSS